LYKSEAKGKEAFVKLISAGNNQFLLSVEVIVPNAATLTPEGNKLVVVAVPAPCVTEPVPVYELFVIVTVSVQAAKTNIDDSEINFRNWYLVMVLNY
jgi:hypothetical protein